ncbi:epsin-2-like [Tubulanus polymorphus]|uniref:epsin-2-like n=1 Tax=Tubulanus polymorphus TaxID=672921 RepID=UPI003DA1DE14
MAMPIRRTIKNVVKNYTDAQVKVREATSNDPWGPSSTLMSDIGDMTYNVMAFTEIMQMIWKRLNDHGKNWRHVYKSLVLLEYILKTGSEKVAQQCKENIFAIQTLKDFQYVEDNKDQGVNVREKAKQLVGLLKDEERLKNERAKAMKAKERFAQSSTGISSTGQSFGRGSGTSAPTLSSGAGGYSDPYGGATGDLSGRRTSVELEQARPSTVGEEELQLQLALAISKEEADQDQKKKRNDDVRFQMAVEESKKMTPGNTPSGNDDGVRPPPSHKPTLVDILDASAKTAAEPVQNDPWAAPTSKPQSDPWAPVPAAANDPWGPPPSIPPRPADPWAPSNDIMFNNSLPVQNDVWSIPATQTQTSRSAQSSPWEPLQQQTATSNSASASLDAFGDLAAPSQSQDEFAVLSSRTAPLTTGPSKSNSFDVLNIINGSGESPQHDPFMLSDMAGSLPDDKKKTPADFLGANSNLVNLDNLVCRPTPPAAELSKITEVDWSGTTNNNKGTTNPFASSNPFSSQPQQRIPINQIPSAGFTAPSSSLPPPIIPSPSQGMQPMMTTTTTSNQQQGGYNPFL